VTGALGLIEIGGFAPALVVLDALDKAAEIRLLQAELNDQLGVLIKISGSTADVKAAAAAAKAVAESMQVSVAVDVIAAPDERTWATAIAPRRGEA
jgi:microcompartment protein CcmL/EutN